MIVREVSSVFRVTAVLAAKVVANEYVRPGKLDAAFLRIGVVLEAYHGRGSNRHGGRTNLVVVRFENIHFAQVAQRHGSLPGYDLVRRHPRREQQCLRRHDPPSSNHLFFFITRSPTDHVWCPKRDSNPHEIRFELIMFASFIIWAFSGVHGGNRTHIFISTVSKTAAFAVTPRGQRCRWWDSNPHASDEAQDLSLLRMPIPNTATCAKVYV